MERQNYNILGSSRAKRILVVAILTIALVVSMIPLGYGGSVNAEPIEKIVTEFGDNNWVEESITSGSSIKFTFTLTHRAPVIINIATQGLGNKINFEGELIVEGPSISPPEDVVSFIDAYVYQRPYATVWEKGTYSFTVKNETDENLKIKYYVSKKQDISKCTATQFGYLSSFYTGQPIKLIDSIKYYDKDSGSLLLEGVDYEVSYTNSIIDIGSGTMTIKGINGFNGFITKDYVIKPSKKTIYTKKTTVSSTKPKKRQLKIKWKKISSATHYQVKYRVKGAKKWKSKTITANKTSLTLKKLKKGKKYQYKVRGIQKLKGYTTYYSKYSKTKTSKKIK